VTQKSPPMSILVFRLSSFVPKPETFPCEYNHLLSSPKFILVLAVISPTARHSENGWEAVNASTLEGNNFDGGSSLLGSTSADSVVGSRPLHRRSALTQSFSYLSSSIYPVSIIKQVPPLVRLAESIP